MLRVRREENGFDRNTQAFEIARQFQRAARAVVREAQELDGSSATRVTERCFRGVTAEKVAEKSFEERRRRKPGA